MQSINTYKYITGAATTLFAGETNRVVLNSININKTLVGTLTVQTGAGTALAVFAIGTVPGPYLQTVTGTEIEGMKIVTSATEDITVCYRNI